MVRKRLHLIVLLLLTILPFAAHSYYDDDSYYDNDSYYRGNSYGYDDYYQPRRHAYYSNGRYDGYNRYGRKYTRNKRERYREEVASGSGGRMPSTIAAPGEKTIIINPRVHAWGAYTASGQLLRSGTATAGNSYCPDIHRSCRTRVGSFRIFSLGAASCKSTKYPLPRGGAPMPYCMFFNKNQGLHGSYQVVNGNVSHGCVRVHVADAAWIRFNFANIGTRVKVLPY